MIKKLLVVIMCFVTIGCVKGWKVETLQEAEQQCVVKVDDFKGRSDLICGDICDSKYQRNIYGDCLYDYTFFRVLDIHGDKIIQLYGIYRSSSWAFLNSAVDSDGNRLDFVEIDRIVGSGITEHFAVNLSRKYIEEHLESGMKIQVYGKRGDHVYNVAPRFVQAFYNALQKAGG